MNARWSSDAHPPVGPPSALICARQQHSASTYHTVVEHFHVVRSVGHGMLRGSAQTRSQVQPWHSVKTSTQPMRTCASIFATVLGMDAEGDGLPRFAEPFDCGVRALGAALLPELSRPARFCCFRDRTSCINRVTHACASATSRLATVSECINSWYTPRCEARNAVKLACPAHCVGVSECCTRVDPSTHPCTHLETMNGSLELGDIFRTASQCPHMLA